ncbi:MAG: STAS domain-containing protein [Pirellulaceae bacterium]
MAKYRHRTFEMYDFRDEAVDALTPKKPRENVDPVDPGLWKFEHFAASRTDSVTLLLFKESLGHTVDASVKMSDELSLIARSLSNDSRVLIDFEGLTEFSSDSIEALAQFKGTLQSKGSQVALCNLEPDVRAAFFPNR